jgi:multiple sugar transport system substrate-binding protein
MKKDKTVFKSIRFGVAASVMLILGCGGETNQPAQQQTVNLENVDPQGQQITFWYQHTGVREEAIKGLIEQFNQTNPHGIQVHGEYAGRYGEIYNKMIVGLQGGILPDLVVAYQNMAMAYHDAEGIVDLKPYMDSAQWGLSAAAKADYISAFVEQDFIAGKQLAFPPNRSLEILYYNATWLKELGYDGPPKTWDEFAQMCRKAHAQPFSKSAKKERSLGYILDVDASRTASMVFSRGGDFMNGDATAYTFNTPQLKENLAMLYALVQDGSVEILGEKYADTGEFSIGQMLFKIDSSSGLPFVKTGVESGTPFEWSIAPLPHIGDKPIVNVYGASIAVCQTAPQRQLAAWLFLRWFTQPTQQAQWVRASNYFPVRRSTAAELEDYFKENPEYRKAYALLDYGKTEPSAKSYEPVRRLVSTAVVDVLEGIDIDQTLQKLEQAANQAILDF